MRALRLRYQVTGVGSEHWVKVNSGSAIGPVQIWRVIKGHQGLVKTTESGQAAMQTLGPLQ